MKQLLSITFIVFCLLSIKAQSLELYHSDVKVNNGDTIFVQTVPHNFDQQYVRVKNNTASLKSVLLKKYDLLKSGNATFSFCWAECYPPETNLSPVSIIINPGEYCDNFSAEFEAEDQGTSYVLYTFFDESNTTDSISFYIEYKCSTNAVQSFTDIKSISAFPNPAKNHVNFTYTVQNIDNVSLRIYNMTGEIIYQEPLKVGNNKLTVDISSFPTGIYMYAIYGNNRNLVSKKLIITK